MDSKFGSLTWSKQNDGVLTRREQLKLMRNIALLGVSEAADTLRVSLGLIEPIDIKLADIAPPDTTMVRDAEEFARDTHTPDLLAHGYRSYYFGAILGVYHRHNCYDKEAHFTASLLHDIGLTEHRATPLKQCCFGVSGGRQVRDFLIEKFHPIDKAELVGDAISAHVNLRLPTKEYGVEASLVAKGAICDLFGFEKRRIGNNFKRELLRAYPPGDVHKAVLANEPVISGSRLDVVRRLTGGLPERLWIQDIEV